MARWRRAVELAMKREDIERLTAISRSRTEAASRMERAQMLLTYRDNPSFFAVGQRLGVHHQTFQQCIERAVAYGPLAHSMTDRNRAEPRSRRRPRLGWRLWRARRPRSTAIRTSCGRHGCWRATHARMDPLRDTTTVFAAPTSGFPFCQSYSIRKRLMHFIMKLFNGASASCFRPCELLCSDRLRLPEPGR